MTVVKTDSPPSWRMVYTVNRSEEVVAATQLVLAQRTNLAPYSGKYM